MANKISSTFPIMLLNNYESILILWMKKEQDRLVFNSFKIPLLHLDYLNLVNKCNSLLIVIFFITLAVDLDGSGTIEFN